MTSSTWILRFWATLPRSCWSTLLSSSTGAVEVPATASSGEDEDKTLAGSRSCSLPLGVTRCWVFMCYKWWGRRCNWSCTEVPYVHRMPRPPTSVNRTLGFGPGSEGMPRECRKATGLEPATAQALEPDGAAVCLYLTGTVNCACFTSNASILPPTLRTHCRMTMGGNAHRCGSPVHLLTEGTGD